MSGPATETTGLKVTVMVMTTKLLESNMLWLIQESGGAEEAESSPWNKGQQINQVCENNHVMHVLCNKQ